VKEDRNVSSIGSESDAHLMSDEIRENIRLEANGRSGRPRFGVDKRQKRPLWRRDDKRFAIGRECFALRHGRFPNNLIARDVDNAGLADQRADRKEASIGTDMNAMAKSHDVLLRLSAPNG